MERYWIGVVSKEHILIGVRGGFCQLNHGKAAPLKRMHMGDWILFYSPKQRLEAEEKLQSFTAVAELTDDRIYLVSLTDSFMPYRRNASFIPVPEDVPLKQVSVSPLWREAATRLRYGHFEISRELFLYITEKMRISPETFKPNY